MRAVSTAFFAAVITLLSFSSASAQSAETFVDLPVDGAITMREAYSPVAEEIHTFHNFVILPVMVVISLFVLALLIWIVVRYNKKANPVPQKFSHNTLLEVVWTVVPIFILIFIALFSFDLLYLEDKMPDGQVYEYEAGVDAVQFPNDFAASRTVKNTSHLEVALVDQATGEKQLLDVDAYDVDGFGEENLVITLAEAVPAGYRLQVIGGRSRAGQRPFLGIFGEDKSKIIPAPSVTIKATGFQWGWTYNYPDFGDFEFDALIAPKEDVSPELFRLATTNDIVVPAGTTIRIVTTARDVIHSWAMANFGVKIDAVPGRINETWFYTDQEGMFYGQCSEICGIDHAFMPISVRVVSRAEFEVWVNEQLDLNGMEPFFETNDQLAAAGLSGAVN